MRAASKLIDKTALSHNIKALSAIAPASKMIAVIKANAYGHEATAVYDALDEAGLFAVASAEEALALRRAGSKKQIVLLEGAFEPSDVQLAFANNFELVIATPEQLTWLLAFPHTFSRVWFKLDTGMGRLGFQAHDADQAMQKLLTRYSQHQTVIMTHFASADSPDRGYTEKQISSFDEFAKNYPDCEQSLCNSAGTLSYPQAHRSYVRCGISLYGVSPLENHHGTDHGLAPAMTLKTRVMSVKKYLTGEKIGYGCTYQMPAPGHIAICEVGYADGYLCFIPNGTPVIIGGRRYQLAGRVSMDMIAVSVDQHVAAGDEVICWGKTLPIEIIADRAGTVPHQLLTAVTERPKMVLT